MNQSKSTRVVSALLAATFAIMSFVGCSDLDSSFGTDFIPNSQELELFTLEDNSSFETALYKSDSISAANIGIGMFGAERHTAFGERRAGFFSQFVPLYALDDEWFGYQPVFDSILLYYDLVAYSGDTTLCQQFEVYEVLSDDFLVDHADSIFYTDFDTSILGLSDEPMFTFTFPDPDRGVYTNSTYVRMFINDLAYSEAMDFIDRLMLEDDEPDEDIYDPYQRELFIEKFKGVYIKPVSVIDMPTDELTSTGATYTIDLGTSGFGFYGRSMYESDPEIVYDTVGMNYIFEDTYTEYYGMAINVIEHTYDVDMDFGELTPTLRIEGMCGVVGQITITQPLFDQLYAKLQEETDNLGNLYNTLYVNQARLDIYITPEAGGSYDPTDLIPLEVTPWLNSMPTRLGLYKSMTNYIDDDGDWTLEGIEDYNYLYETTTGYALNYGGYLNRSLGCYEMNIESQLQEAWNSYLEAVDAAGGDPSAINWDDVEERTFYIAPASSDLYTSSYVSLQGMPDDMNNAPMRLRVSFTLVK